MESILTQAGLLYHFWPAQAFIIAFCVILGIILSGTIMLTFIGLLYLINTLFGDEIRLFIKKKWSGISSDLNEIIRENIQKTFFFHGAENIPRGKPVLYAAHPHGLFSMATYFHWATFSTGWPEDLCKIKIAIHSSLFLIPGVRELLDMHGCIKATRESIERALDEGYSVIIQVGGINEIMLTESNRMNIYVKTRKGFLEIAEKKGVPIIPVLTFGENELFPLQKDQWTLSFQKGLKDYFGITVPIPTAQSFFNWFSLLQKPLKPSVETWIGEPLKTPTKKEFIDSLKRLFSKNRPSYCRELIFY
jgi:1-acyl-sn-glycerol-3-phosphate acyltransferase